jgi:hypothetical protein
MDAMHVMVMKGLGVPTGPSCRRCSQPIDRADQFGVSERVCGPCRGDVRGRPERRPRRKR